MGWEGDQDNSGAFKYEEDRNDVKFVVFTLYEIITREFCFREEFYPHELDMSTILEKPEWEKDPDVRLDSPVLEYRRVLEEWVAQRQIVDKEINHFTKTPEPLSWPSLPDFLTRDMASSPARRPAELRCTLIQLGEDFLKWQRLPTRDLPLPPGKRLLATGDVSNDDDGVLAKEASAISGH